MRAARRALAPRRLPTAIARSLDAKAALSVRPDPFFVLGVCETRLGFPRLALRSLHEAVAREPGNWEYHYGQALVRAAAGLDPPAAARTAQRARHSPPESFSPSIPQTLLHGKTRPEGAASPRAD